MQSILETRNSSMIKTFLTVFSLLIPVLFTINSLSNETCKDSGITPNNDFLHTIVLDAGHGGKDDGCSGKHSKEKHLALNITLALGQLIETTFPTIRVIYTRTSDIFIPLYQRAAIANENNADLFISIHCNAMGAKLAYIRGTETFVMGIPSNDNHTANRENQSVYLEEDYQSRYEGFDTNSDEGYIFSSIFQNAYLDRSILLAEKVEKYVMRHSKRKSRGVRQDDFVVLRETTMPSVLIETGFLTNSKDEVYLNSSAGQADMAKAIFLAFQEYKEEVEREAISIISTPVIEEPVVFNEAPPVVAVPVSLPPTQPVATEITESEAPYRATEPVAYDPPKASEQEIVKEIPSENPQAAEIIEEEIKEELSENELEERILEEKEIVPSPTIRFRIQLAASKTPIDTNTPKWEQVKELEVLKEKQLFKYMLGNFGDYEAAAQQRIQLTKLGFYGAFVVAYKDEQRISLSEARIFSSPPKP